MTKGHEYAKAMEDILKLMYERGAIGGVDVVPLEEISENVGMDQHVALHLMNQLKEQELVTMVVSKVYRLTGPGFAKARRLVQMDGKPAK